MTDDTRFYIDGAWLDRADAPRLEVTNPYSEEVIGHVALPRQAPHPDPVAGQQMIERAVHRAKERAR